jgi:hypothetical protein
MGNGQWIVGMLYMWGWAWCSLLDGCGAVQAVLIRIVLVRDAKSSVLDKTKTIPYSNR